MDKFHRSAQHTLDKTSVFHVYKKKTCLGFRPYISDFKNYRYDMDAQLNSHIVNSPSELNFWLIGLGLADAAFLQ